MVATGSVAALSLAADSVAAGELEGAGEAVVDEAAVGVVESATGAVEAGTIKVLVPTGSIGEGELAGAATAGRGVVPSGLDGADAPVVVALAPAATEPDAGAADAVAAEVIGAEAVPPDAAGADVTGLAAAAPAAEGLAGDDPLEAPAESVAGELEEEAAAGVAEGGVPPSDSDEKGV